MRSRFVWRFLPPPPQSHGPIFQDMLTQLSWEATPLENDLVYERPLIGILDCLFLLNFNFVVVVVVVVVVAVDVVVVVVVDDVFILLLLLL